MSDTPEHTARSKLYRGIKKHLGDCHRRLDTLSDLFRQISNDVYTDRMILDVGIKQLKAISQQTAAMEQTVLGTTKTDNPVGWCVILIRTHSETDCIREIRCIGPFLDKDKASEYASNWNGQSLQTAITWINKYRFSWMTPAGWHYLHKPCINDIGYWLLELSHTTPYGWTECHQTMIGPFTSRDAAIGYRTALEASHRHILTMVYLKPADPESMEQLWSLPMWETCHGLTRMKDDDIIRLCGSLSLVPNYTLE